MKPLRPAAAAAIVRWGRLAGAAAVCALLASPASAQIGRVAGTILDETGRPVKGATITAENREHTPSTFTSTSDEKGRFSVLGLRRGAWVFTVQAAGFEPARSTVDVVTIRPNPPLTVRLVKGSAPAAASRLGGIDAREIQRRIEAADALEASGDLDGAVAAYRDLAARVPSLTSVYLRIGAILERKPDAPGARAAYERLLELEPSNTRAQAAIARLQR
jgi:hypothetical protein